MPKERSETLSIQLNRFLHRIESKAIIIEMASQHRCHLKRIRRSKNWLITGTIENLKSLSAQLKTTNVIWIAEAINKKLPKPATHDIASLIKMNPAITVNQLQLQTGCSVSEARAAIDNAENFNIPI